MEAEIRADDPKAAEILDAVAATLDHQLPRWRLRIARTHRDGLPPDDRRALANLSCAQLSRSPIPTEMFGFHPELLATATRTEIQAEARRLTSRSRSVPGLVERLVHLRDHARRIQSFKRAAGMPFATALRSAHESGRLEAFFGRLPPDAPPFADASSLDEFRRAFAPKEFSRQLDLTRFLKRLDCAWESATGLQMRRARVSVAEFVFGSQPTCGPIPLCGRCELLARGLCQGHAPGEVARPELSERSGNQSRSRRPGRASRPMYLPGSRVRGLNLVRRGALRLAALDARWLALRHRRPPLDELQRQEWIRKQICPTSERLRIVIQRELARLERGLARIEEECCGGATDDREQIWEQAWRIVSRLRAIERERGTYDRELRQGGVIRGGA